MTNLGERTRKGLQDAVACLPLLHAPQSRTDIHECNSVTSPVLFELSFHRGVWFQGRLGSRHQVCGDSDFAVLCGFKNPQRLRCNVQCLDQRTHQFGLEVPHFQCCCFPWTSYQRSSSIDTIVVLLVLMPGHPTRPHSSCEPTRPSRPSFQSSPNVCVRPCCVMLAAL